MSSILYFVDVLLPLPLAHNFTYLAPEELLPGIQVGSRVIVPFGVRKLYTGIIIKIHNSKPTDYQVKSIYSLLDERPIVRELQLQFWQWLADYYMCSFGEVMKAALPTGLKLESETLVTLAENVALETSLKEREKKILDALIPGKEMSLQMLSKVSGIKNILPLVHDLIGKNALAISEGLTSSSKVRMNTFVRLGKVYRNNPDSLKLYMDGASRAKKQIELLHDYLDLSGFSIKSVPQEVEKKALLEKSAVSYAVLHSLCSKNILECYNKEIERPITSENRPGTISTLSLKQGIALNEVKASFKKRSVCLLHGLTSSGKTEIYIHLIEECVRTGKQALYLVPEIALTTQLSDRLKEAFGNSLGVYHSKFPDAERVEIWKKLMSGQEYQVILGVRSSIFLPFRSLGLVIVDEEHEGSFKQQDPAPRYHARNAAIILASMYDAKILLGTATPSLETYYNCQKDKFGLVELLSRHYEMAMPEIIAVNTKELRRKKIMKSLFSPLLMEKMEEALLKGKQVILFQNRRGYAPVLECKVCGWIPKCYRCDVSLTLHKLHNKLTCHYCGYEQDLPGKCPSCGSTGLSTHGFGTEQIEEEVKALFPDARVSRMDTDTTRSRHSYEHIIHDFESGKTNILIGTQMVSKGLDFENVNVVGILNADQMLNYPDFRSCERSFQLMAQVSGRAGRKGERGVVIIQTSDPDQDIIKDIITNDFKSFYNREMKMRKQFNYPPFSRIIQIRFKHRDASIVRRAALFYADIIGPVLGKRLLGPDQPPVSRIKNYYLQQLLLKIETEASVSKVKEFLFSAKNQLGLEPDFKSVQLIFDIDPV